MNIGGFSINNRYVVLSIVIAIVLFGVYSRLEMPEQLAPDTTPPMATVMTTYPGASVQDVVEDVVEPMEDEFRRIDGVINISSTNQDNLAMVEVEFDYEVDIEDATIDIQNSINRIREDLPEGMEEPRILEFGAAQMPVMTISLSSDSLDMQDVRQMAEDEISYELQLVEDVAAIDIFGGYNQEVKVDVDKNKLTAYGISLERISAELNKKNIHAPAGEVKHENKELLVRFDDSFETLQDIKNTSIKLEDGNIVYLKDLAEVELGTEDQESLYKFNGQTSIAMMVSKSADANTIDVVENVNEKLEELKEEYPHLNFQVAQDDSVFTEQMVSNMTESVILAIVFTIITMILFISKINQSIVVAISMPLIFLCTMILMFAFDMEFDMVTMSALILSIGWVIDATVVVVENIMTHYKEYGKDIYKAAVDGTNEIWLPLLAGGSTTLIVLVPLLFIEGFVGEMFGPLSSTIIFAITSSVFVAIIIIPLLTVMFMKFDFKKAESYLEYVTVPFNKMMSGLLEIYLKLLNIALKNKGKVYILLIILLALSARTMYTIGVEMLPKFDSGVVYISVELEPGSPLDETSSKVEEIENILKEEKNVESYDSQLGYEAGTTHTGDFGVMDTNQAFVTANLNTRLERDETIWEFQERVRRQLDRIPGIRRYVVREEGGTPATGTSLAPLDIKISGPNVELLSNIADDLMEDIREVEGATNLYKSYTMDDKQLVINTNRKRTEELGLNSADISRQVLGAVEGIQSSTMDIEEATGLDISVRYSEDFREDVDDLMDIYVRNPQGNEAPLREVADVKLQERANVLTTEDNEYTINILGYTHDRAFGHVAGDVGNILKEVVLPRGYDAVLTGEMEDIRESIVDMLTLMIIAIILVYLLLVSQFKSFLHPISIMSVIPLVVIGIVPALLITGKYISMPVMLGFILLAGTIINNSILLVDNMNSKRDGGAEIFEAARGATTDRFRPIMMTAISDVVGMTPLALQLALGAERFSPLAIAVIGGIIVATFLTMIVVPVVYDTLEVMKKKLIES